MKLSRAERRAVRFINEQYPALYNAIFGEIMALSSDLTRAQALHAVAEICREAGQAIICANMHPHKNQIPELIFEQTPMGAIPGWVDPQWGPS